MRVFLASIPLPGTKVVIIGDGHAAAAKARLFDGSGTDLVWYAGPGGHADPRCQDRWPEAADLAGSRLVFIALADPEAAAGFARAGRAAGAQVNVVDQPALSDFHTPSFIDRDGVVVGIATGGVAPVLAREVRSRIEAALPEGLDRLARLSADLRDTVIAALPDFIARRRFWELAFRGAPKDLAVAGRMTEARREMLRLLARPEAAGPAVVHLVGAGPGDPELLTLKALSVLQDADVVIHDRLAPPEVLARARRDARRIYVGKRRGEHAVPQDEIAELIIAEARAGHRVVRLKGGDPFIFGRGGEELAAVRAAGLEVVVVPGVTAALGCAAAVGIPLTHRDQARAVSFVTAETRPGAPGPDWSRFGEPDHTIAVYMGVVAAGDVEAGLLAAGRAPDTPVAVIENGSRPDQRVVTGRLDGLARLVRRERVVSPALLVIGEVAAWASASGTAEIAEAAA
ncbi:MAG TPA: siroheme synthase CysG [Brevundimonas sp.]|jgi:uroporphyrin-III C-methyltransferase/precorrin-2 dehydrogenase/sirohydrochlorin ferrochelatase|uniref:siroheme synthase CysG n=1 Tax=Brevundimonas sp. TaxID=1871086 RepID=UPI002E0EA842|nr:siroheme synthase CysG [Brevundimonas sp.]